MAEDLGWSVGAFIREQLERACERGRSGGSVRDRGVDVGSIDSRVILKGGAFGVSDIPCAAFCSHLTGALVRPRR